MKEYNNSYFQSLKKGWLEEDKNQLHMGGWKFTKELFSQIKIEAGSNVLDICCGEGSTLNWVCKTFDVRGTGVDFNKKSIKIALDLYSKNAQYVADDLYKFSISENDYDLIYGQDPDAIASFRRQIIFNKIHQGLKKGGEFVFHHWVPFLGISKYAKIEFDNINLKTGYTSHKNLNGDAYFDALKKSGFKNIEIINMSKKYEQYYMNLIESYKEKKINYDWLNDWLKFNTKYPTGILVKCIK